jgi:hypothetical protein
LAIFFAGDGFGADFTAVEAVGCGAAATSGLDVAVEVASASSCGTSIIEMIFRFEKGIAGVDVASGNSCAAAFTVCT